MKATLALAALVAALDQATKGLIVALVMQPPRIIEVTGFFNLVLTHNTGVSFGLLAHDSPWAAVALTVLALAVTLGLLVWARGQRRRTVLVSIGLIAGGAVGNALDRLLGAILGWLERPGVVDFLDFHLAGWHWPAFNLADSAITVGVGLLLLDSLFLEPRGGKLRAGRTEP